MPCTPRVAWWIWLAILLVVPSCASRGPVDPDAPLYLGGHIRSDQRVCFQWVNDARGYSCTSMATLRRYVDGLQAVE